MNRLTLRKRYKTSAKTRLLRQQAYARSHGKKVYKTLASVRAYHRKYYKQLQVVILNDLYDRQSNFDDEIPPKEGIVVEVTNFNGGTVRVDTGMWKIYDQFDSVSHGEVLGVGFRGLSVDDDEEIERIWSKLYAQWYKY